MPEIVSIRMRKNSPHYIEYHIITPEEPQGRWKYVTDLKGRLGYDPKLFRMLLPYVPEHQRVAAGLHADVLV